MTSKNLTEALNDIGYVCHPIIQEVDKYSADRDQRGMYPSPISIATPSYGWIAFLSFDAKSGTSTLFKARLHSPVDKVIALGKNLKAKEIHCLEGIIFLASDSWPIKVIEFKEGLIYLTNTEKKKKDDLIQLGTTLDVSPAGIIAEITSRLKKYSEAVKHQYLTHTVRNDEIHFWNRATQPSFEAMVCVDSDLIYAAEVINKSIISVQIEKDGAGVKVWTFRQLFLTGPPGGK